MRLRPVVALVLALSAHAAADTTITLRGGERPPTTLHVVGVGELGVQLAARPEDTLPGAPPQSISRVTIGWDRVSSVNGALAAQAAPFLPIADAAWRARSRLERGDWVSAEPLFEGLYARYRGKPGPTAAVVAEGLLRVRLQRGSHVGAIDPFLSLVAAPADATVLRAHASWAIDAGLGSIVDPGTGLCPSLPPIWLALPALEPLASGKALADWAAAGSGLRAATLAQLYAAGAAFELGRSVPLPVVGEGDTGLMLVATIVQSRAGDPQTRSAARRRIAERLRPVDARPAAEEAEPALPAWQEAWLRVAIGRSLLLEPRAEDKLSGVMQLLHVPARLAPGHPYLSGIALAEAAVALRELGDEAGSRVLRAELERLLPTHPALEWEPFRRLRIEAPPVIAAPPSVGASPAETADTPSVPESAPATDPARPPPSPSSAPPEARVNRP